LIKQPCIKTNKIYTLITKFESIGMDQLNSKGDVIKTLFTFLFISSFQYWIRLKKESGYKNFVEASKNEKFAIESSSKWSTNRFWMHFSFPISSFSNLKCENNFFNYYFSDLDSEAIAS
jgi:hypothetical protein